MLTFEPLPRRPDDWNERIAGFDTKTLFHESGWHDHLLDIHPDGRLVYHEIRDGSGVVGYYCALRVKKLGLPIHGSPLGGTGTNFMGPIVPHDLDQEALIKGLSGLSGFGTFLHLELAHPWLERSLMERLGYRVHEDVTHVIELAEDEETAWSDLTSPARNRIRKGRKNDLVVERTDDRAIADQFFAQFEEVYGKQGMTTPFGPDRPRSLFDRLLPVDRLLPLRVRKPDGEVIATGLFPYDENCIYFWGGASWLEHQHLCPNELLHWEVIRYAVESRIPRYNMCGGASRFKDKFGGDDVPYLHYSRSALPGLGLARDLYRKLHFWQLKRG